MTYKIRNTKQADEDLVRLEKHRLVYRIIDEEVVVLLISAYGHYDDK